MCFFCWFSFLKQTLQSGLFLLLLSCYHLSLLYVSLSQRKDGVLDEEALQLTQQLLSSNPDFATLWNYRREILMHLETVRLTNLQRVWIEKSLRRSSRMIPLFLLVSETRMKCRNYTRLSCCSWSLALKWIQSLMAPGTTEAGSQPVCLDQTGPESWVCVIAAWVSMTATVSTKVFFMLLMCSTALFWPLSDGLFSPSSVHCWDYRRMVVKMSGVSVEKELEFTDCLIGSNFSNYSSWHYRSTLLPLLHPESPEQTSPVTCEHPQATPPSSPQTHFHRLCEEQLLKGLYRTVVTSRGQSQSIYSFSWLFWPA